MILPVSPTCRDGSAQPFSTTGRDAAATAVDEAVDDRVGKLFRKIEYLNVIGNVSPMIGLFGTVMGILALGAGVLIVLDK